VRVVGRKPADSDRISVAHGSDGDNPSTDDKREKTSKGSPAVEVRPPSAIVRRRHERYRDIILQ